MSASAVRVRRLTVTIGVLAAAAIPALLSDFLRALSAYAAITAILVLSLVVLTGFVGQISFCQFSFSAIGAFTVGALTVGHGWNFWPALVVGVLFAAVVGVLVGIPALRLSGLFLAILTISVALFFDRYVLASGVWNGFSGGLSPWRPVRPTIFGLHLTGEYTFYLFVLAIFLLATLLVWNLRRGKVGRVLRAIRGSEIAASTIGLDVTLWKLAAFGLSAGLAGLSGGLLAVAVGSVSPQSFDFIHSISLAATATVMGVSSIGAAAAGGIFLIFGDELLKHTPLSSRYFPLILGTLLIVQLVFTPEGLVTKTESDVGHLLSHRSRKRAAAAPEPAPDPAPEPAEVP